jgi:Domain of unknown function (DUF3854)
LNLPRPEQPCWIENDHRFEWEQASGVDEDIVTLNVRSLEDLEVSDFGHDVTTPIADLLNWKVVRFGNQVKQNIRGWWVSGVDPRNDFKPMEWGRFKPDIPFIDRKTGKPQKYASPLGVPSRATFLDVPDRIWQLVADRAGIPISGDCFWRWVLECNVPIILTEGEKKAGCLLSLGYAAIALPGIFSGYRKATKRLIEDLNVVCGKDRPLYICFDNDPKEETRQNVNKATSRLGKLFAMQGCKVNVVELPGTEKGVDDFIVAQGREAFDREFQRALPYHKWQTRLYARLTYEPTLELNQDKIGPFCILGDQPKLICVKSPKGSGKTHSLEQIVARAKENDQRVLVITHRVQLGQDICQRIGLPYITEAGVTKEAAPHGYGLCIDSLHPESQARFDPEDWKDAIVIIDEVEQVLWHLFNANTDIRQQRLAVLEQLQQLLLQTLRGGHGQVVLLDADLTDVSINFVLNLAEARFWVKPWILINHHNQPNRRICHQYNQSSPKFWLAALIQAIWKGDRTFIVTQGQKVKSVWSATNFEQMILRFVPDCKILRIDSETIADPTHAAYGVIDRLNSVLPEYDVVIATPTIETGVSIDSQGHFDSVWGCFWGVSPTNSARQALARVRADIPRHVWAVGHSNCGKIAGGASTKFALSSAQNEIATATVDRLKQWWENDEGYHTHETALHTWAEMACRINTEMMDYRQSIAAGLEDEGYQVETATFEPCDEVSYLLLDWLEPEELQKIGDLNLERTRTAFVRVCHDLLRGIRVARYGQECQDTVEVDLITDDEAALLKIKRNRTREERLRYRKWILHKKYGGVEVTVDLIERDDDGWHAQLQTDYFSGTGAEFADERDVKLLNLLSRNHQLWYPVFIASQIGLKVQILKHFKIRELANPDQEVKNSTPLLQWLDEESRKYSQKLRQVLGINICEKDSPIAIANKFLKKLGMKLTKERKEGARGAWEWIYAFHPPDDGRDDVFERWFERDLLSRSEAAVVPESLISNMGVAALARNS